jgi:hypothetical protein|tara:strand:+ start:3033 stop:3746 length:714 start_codon:yes stop_codon:yes gene_type:complete
MGLPIIKHPTFELTIPSTKQKIKYRPFLVKEEKILLLAQSSENVMDMINAIKQIINNCIVEGNINLDLLPSFDIEYMFLRLRANSVNSTSSLTFKDPDDPEAKPQKIDVDLLTIEVKWPKDIKNKIDLGEGISMSLKYPTYDEIGSINNENAAEGTMQLIRICADKIYSGVDTVDDLKDYSEQEIGNFLDSLKGEALKGIQLFFEDMPKLSHTIDYEIKGKKKQHTFEGIADFFTYA